MRAWRIALGVGLLGLTTAALVFSFWQADDPATEITAIDSTPGAAAMRISIDPETGALVPGKVPVAKLDAELEEALSRSGEGLVEVHHPDGSVSIDLQGRFQNASMARIDSSGKLHTTCVNSADAAHAFCNGEHAGKQEAEEQ